MCLFSAIYHLIPECPLLILANREEFYTRPAAEPDIVPCQPEGNAWLGGRDLQKGGTWLGVNRDGLVVAVANRAKTHVPAEGRSRGLLCRDLLCWATTQTVPSPEAVLEEAHRQLQRHAFDGFNLLVLGRRQGFVLEAGDNVRTVPLAEGIHSVTNGPWRAANDPRLERLHKELEAQRSRGGSLKDWLAAGKDLLGRRDSPPICLHGADRGTVSATLLALTDDPQQARYLFANGPPSRTAFRDHSVLLQRLLSGNVTR